MGNVEEEEEEHQTKLCPVGTDRHFYAFRPLPPTPNNLHMLPAWLSTPVLLLICLPTTKQLHLKPYTDDGQEVFIRTHTLSALCQGGRGNSGGVGVGVGDGESNSGSELLPIEGCHGDDQGVPPPPGVNRQTAAG